MCRLTEETYQPINLHSNKCIQTSTNMHVQRGFPEVILLILPKIHINLQPILTVASHYQTTFLLQINDVT